MILEKFGYAVSPLIAFAAALIMLFSKRNLGDKFLFGAREGMETALGLIPTMVMLICAVRMFCASGAVDIIAHFSDGLFSKLGIPTDLIPLILVRPFSGSASTAIADSLFRNVGPDSFAGKSASVLMGSSDTIVYILSLYFGAVNIKKTRYALAASFIILIFCTFISVRLTRLMF